MKRTQTTLALCLIPAMTAWGPGGLVPESFVGTNVSGWFGVMADTQAGTYLIQNAPSGAVVTGTLTSVR